MISMKKKRVSINKSVSADWLYVDSFNVKTEMISAETKSVVMKLICQIIFVKTTLFDAMLFNSIFFSYKLCFNSFNVAMIFVKTKSIVMKLSKEMIFAETTSFDSMFFD